VVSKTIDVSSNLAAPAKENRFNKIMNKIINYIKDSIDELQNKVTWPTWAELQSSTMVVMAASVIFSLVILAIDQVFAAVMKLVYETIA
jgi:preprotein translocase subunit SecE